MRLLLNSASSAIFVLTLAPAMVAAQQLAFELPGAKSVVVVQPQQGQVTAVCFLGTQCPMVRNYVGTLSRIQRDFQESGVRVVGVMSNLQDSEAEIKAFADQTGASFPIAIDADQSVADQFGATRTPEVYLLDSQLNLRYHGRIDDQYAPGVAREIVGRQDLRVAIEEVLAGKPVSIKETNVLGCIIGRAPTNNTTPDSSHVSFYEDVVPVLQRNCVECHRAGEIGPFAMDEYHEVVGWADTMLETIEDGRMPPWHADPKVGTFANQRIMTAEDKEILREWVSSGAAEGNRASRPKPAVFSSGWHFEQQPDVVLPMRNRPFRIPRDGVVEYQYFVVDPGFKEDKWIKAAQVLPGRRDVVHHAIVFVRPPDGSAFRGIGWLTAYVPGQRSLQLPEGRARFVPAGSKLVFQMHYTPNGVEREDVTQVGLVFADERSVTHEVITLMAIDQEFEIPPRDDHFSVSAALNWLPAGGELLAATPHMHFRGKSFELRRLTSGDGEEPILRVPRYDFNWQHTYEFANAIPLDTTQRLSFEATFDNSANNPFNPAPDDWVTWGDQTWEEMAVAFFEVSLPRGSAMVASGSATSVDSSSRKIQIENYVNRVLEAMDGNGDDQIQKSEAAIIVRHMTFNHWDLDRDGVATRSEIERVAERLFSQ